MYNPIRKNRNIGTFKQGYKKSNKHVIPSSCYPLKSFYERLESYTKVERVIQGIPFRFIIETTRTESYHACTLDDLVYMLGLVIQVAPHSHFKKLNTIILRQPKRKEEVLSPVWGRLIYSYEFENDYGPAIILEAVNYSRSLFWPRNLCVQDQLELQRIIGQSKTT